MAGYNRRRRGHRSRSRSRRRLRKTRRSGRSRRRSTRPRRHLASRAAPAVKRRPPRRLSLPEEDVPDDELDDLGDFDEPVDDFEL